MIRRYLLSLALLWIAGCASVQLPVRSDAELPSTDPFQGANLILIDTSDDEATARRKITELLQLQNYVISQVSEPGEIATEPRTFGPDLPGAARYFVRVTKNEDGETRLQLRGEWVPNTAADSGSFMQFPRARVEPIGERRSIPWMSWQEMVDLAAGYRGGTILYDRM